MALKPEDKRSISLSFSFLPILSIVAFGLLSVLRWKAGMLIPILFGIFVAGLVGTYLGFSWKELQASLVAGVSRALAPLFIMIIIGMIIGSWIQGGVIPSLIYYSLKIISPKIYIPAACLVTAIIATATGTSFTSLSTVGLALMVTGLGMGFPAPLLAGAIISGAYFGDSISPLSDTTNLASAMVETNLFELVGHMLKTGLPAMGLSLVLYYLLGLGYASQVELQGEAILGILTGLKEGFVITPWLILVPVVTILLSIKKLPAIPSLVLVALLGALAAFFVQGASFTSVIQTLTNGFKSDTGIAMIDSLLSRGGINSMAETVLLLICAVAFGGILEEIGALNRILEAIMTKITSVGSLVLVSLLSSLAVGFATGAQLLAIMIPSRMFGKAFREKNLHPKNLGRIAQSIGCTCINLVPWSVPALFAQRILDVQAIEFIPYIFFAYGIILVNLIFGYTGFTMDKLSEEERLED